MVGLTSEQLPDPGCKILKVHGQLVVASPEKNLNRLKTPQKRSEEYVIVWQYNRIAVYSRSTSGESVGQL
jgi:hypothetical protein